VKPRFSGVVLAVAMALAGSLLTVPATAPASAHAAVAVAKKPWEPATGGFFNDPWGGTDSQYRIERQIVAAIRHAKPKSHIRIAVYSFDRVNVAKALIKAHRRGVYVQVLHNDHQYTKAMKMLKKALGTHRGKKSWDYTCKTGCRSVQGVLHDKIYLFEHTGGARDVVMTGSANLTRNATVHQFNDLLVKKDAPNLHSMMLQLFWELKKDKPAKPLYEHKVLANYQLWVMPHPRTTSANDPLMRILRQVRCQGANGGTGTHGRTKIRVSMHSWASDRGTYIARKLRHLYADGCDVKVMWALAGSTMKKTIGATTPRGQVPRRANGYNTDCDELHEVDMYSHQKYMTISGHYGDDRSASYVFTGSSNWTFSGISGDEMILRATGANLVKRWNTNFTYIWEHRSRPVGGSGGFRPTPPTCTSARAGATERRVPATTIDPSFSGRYWESD
jgi:phosphatidylserine/phosphatidylglycerophosphate/cardiolipin synthase-like enzyme